MTAVPITESRVKRTLRQALTRDEERRIEDAIRSNPNRFQIVDFLWRLLGKSAGGGTGREKFRGIIKVLLLFAGGVVTQVIFPAAFQIPPTHWEFGESSRDWYRRLIQRLCSLYSSSRMIASVLSFLIVFRIALSFSVVSQ